MLAELTALCSPAALPVTARSGDSMPALGPLFELAERHDLAGLLVLSLLEGWSACLPEDVQEGLAIYRDGMRLEAFKAEQQLAEALNLLAARGLPAMPFKGPFLAHSAYADPTARLCLDLDILVHQRDVASVVEALVEGGFVHQIGLGAKGIAWRRRYSGDYILYRPGGLPIEPHWDPAPPNMAFGIDVEGIWRRSQRTTFLGANCYLPSPEDHLFLLALHGAKARWHKLKWAADIAAYLRTHPDLDLAALRGLAASQGCRRIVDLALLLSHRLFSIPTSAPPTDTTTVRLAAEILERLDRTSEPPNDYHKITPFLWKVRERPRDRCRYAVRTLLTPSLNQWNQLPLPLLLHPLHVPLKLPYYILTPLLYPLYRAARLMLRRLQSRGEAMR